jgi:hypothetical protein
MLNSNLVTFFYPSEVLWNSLSELYNIFRLFELFLCNWFDHREYANSFGLNFWELLLNYGNIFRPFKLMSDYLI